MQYQLIVITYDSITLTPVFYRARIVFMDIEQNVLNSSLNQTPKLELYLKNRSKGGDPGVIFPVGMILVSDENKILSANPELEILLDIEVGSLIGKLHLDLFSHLLARVKNPGYFQIAWEKALENFQELPVIKLALGSGLNNQLEMIFFPAGIAENPSGKWGGLFLNRTVERMVFNRQKKMLNEMGKETRKISAGVQGNISALAGNIHSWSADLVEDFLRDINHDIGVFNDQLDQILKFIKLFDRIPIYPDSVNVGELINKIINTNEKLKKRIIQPEGYFADFPSIQLDPDLTRLIFEYSLMEIFRVSMMADMIEISGEDRGDTIKLIIENDNEILDSEEMELTSDTPQLYLIRQLISAQSGEITVWGSKTSPKSVLRFEMIFPASQSQANPLEETSKSSSKDTQTGRILVAESQPEYQTLLLQELEEQGYRVDLAIEGSAVLDLAQRINPDLVVIDRNLDGLDGILVTQGIRRWSDVPIIMVSSKTNPDDLLHAFQTGVDDYVTKPFLLDEILVRIDANIRRGRNSSQAFTPDVFISDDVRINSSTRQVWVRGELVELTPIEYNLLFYMSQHRKQIMPYEQIVERAWEGPEKGSRQGLFVHIRRLREKIEQNPKEPKIIQNKWGVGYIFSPSE